MTRTGSAWIVILPATLPSIDLVDGVLCPDVAELYRTIVLGVPGVRELIGRLGVCWRPTGDLVLLCSGAVTRWRRVPWTRRYVAAGFGRINMFQLSLLPGSELCNKQARDRFRMDTRWRVIPRCVGRYPVLGSPMVAAEVDEVCVQLPHLPYEDYRACRKMNLLVAAAYNDAPLAAVTKALRGCGASVFGWLEWMDRLPAGPLLTRVINDFLADTDDQLWTDRDELIDYADSRIDRYLDEDLGNNLLYTSRVRILTDALNDFTDLALRAAYAVLAEYRVHDPTIETFLTEAIEYHRLQLTDVFARSGHTALIQPARFDVEAYLHAPVPVPLAGVALPQPMTRRFCLDREQTAIVSGYLGKFGETAAGAGRLLSKVHLSDLLRRTELIDDQPANPS